MGLDLAALRKNLAARKEKTKPSQNSDEVSSPQSPSVEPPIPASIPKQSAWTGERRQKKAPDTQREFPHSIEAEQGVLGSMLNDPSCIPEATRACQPWFLYVPSHRTIFEALSDHWDSGAGLDLITFTQFLRDKGLLETIGGAAFVTSLFTFVPTAANIQYYLEIVREKAILREMISAGTHLARAAHGTIEGDEVGSLLEDFSRKIERIKYTAGGPNGAKELTTEHLRGMKGVPDSNVLVGSRWLVRGGNCLWAGGAGYGKSSLTMQLAIYWACGQPIFGLRPQRATKSLIVQAENDDYDIAEQYNGVVEGIAATGDLDIESQQAEIDKNLVVLRMEGISGFPFLSKLGELLQVYQPDLVWIDPLFAFAGCDLIDAEKVGHFLREGLFPLFTKFACCGQVIHHVSKPARGAQQPGVSWLDEQYLSFGSSEIQNAFRAVNVLKPPADEPGVFRLVFSKRGERSQAKDLNGDFTTSIFLKHSFPHICWVQVEEPEKKKTNAKWEPSDVLDVMSVLEGLTVTELQEKVSTQTRMSRITFYRLWKGLKSAGKVRVDSDDKWYPKRLISDT